MSQVPWEGHGQRVWRKEGGWANLYQGKEQLEAGWVGVWVGSRWGEWGRTLYPIRLLRRSHRTKEGPKRRWPLGSQYWVKLKPANTPTLS